MSPGVKTQMPDGAAERFTRALHATYLSYLAALVVSRNHCERVVSRGRHFFTVFKNAPKPRSTAGIRDGFFITRPRYEKTVFGRR